jgi:osmotically-inducible protein OsmY
MTRTVIALLAAGAIAATSCGRSETDFEEVADRALDNAGLTAAEADYDSDAKVVHLTGTVASESDRQRAGDVVIAAVGSGAQVANEVTVEGGHAETANDFDSAIETRLNNVVELDTRLNEHEIAFDAVNGVVTITGRVPSASEKEQVGTLARNESGVRDVVNSLEVGPNQ